MGCDAMVPKSRTVLELGEGVVGSARVGRQGLEPDDSVVDGVLGGGSSCGRVLG